MTLELIMHSQICNGNKDLQGGFNRLQYTQLSII